MSPEVNIVTEPTGRWRRLPGPIPHTVSRHPCVDLINSRFAEHTGSGLVYDRIEVVEWQRWFADRCGVPIEVPLSPSERGQFLQLRDDLRLLLQSGMPPDAAAAGRLDQILSAAPLQWKRAPRGGRQALTLTWSTPGWGAVMAATVVSYGQLVESGELQYVRRCANPHCTYMFHDETRARSRRWCDVRACGNVVKVRRYRSGAPRPRPAPRG